jgi:hypothetical protein
MKSDYITEDGRIRWWNLIGTIVLTILGIIGVVAMWRVGHPAQAPPPPVPVPLASIIPGKGIGEVEVGRPFPFPSAKYDTVDFPQDVRLYRGWVMLGKAGVFWSDSDPEGPSAEIKGREYSYAVTAVVEKGIVKNVRTDVLQRLSIRGYGNFSKPEDVRAALGNPSKITKMVNSFEAGEVWEYSLGIRFYIVTDARTPGVPTDKPFVDEIEVFAPK